ncbi:MAG: hypothetical protein ACC652_15190 [Acidimicrobiales bacterium]
MDRLIEIGAEHPFRLTVSADLAGALFSRGQGFYCLDLGARSLPEKFAQPAFTAMLQPNSESAFSLRIRNDSRKFHGIFRQILHWRPMFPLLFDHKQNVLGVSVLPSALPPCGPHSVEMEVGVRISTLHKGLGLGPARFELVSTMAVSQAKFGRLGGLVVSSEVIHRGVGPDSTLAIRIIGDQKGQLTLDSKQNQVTFHGPVNALTVDGKDIRARRIDSISWYLQALLGGALGLTLPIWAGSLLAWFKRRRRKRNEEGKPG